MPSQQYLLHNKELVIAEMILYNFCMSKNKLSQLRTSKRRQAMLDFKKAQKLSTNKWAAQAGIPYSTLRNYLNGITQSMTFDNLSKLAESQNVSVGELLGEEEEEEQKLYLDFDILLEVIKDIEEALLHDTGHLTPEQKAKHTLRMYMLMLSKKDPENFNAKDFLREEIKLEKKVKL